ncbi:MAG: histidine kinase [Algicola sp.]|nr:histidine kinase [Algicola sp.]
MITLTVAPPTDRGFWTIHLFIWLALASVFFAIRQDYNSDSMGLGLFFAVSIVVVNTLVCLFFRELIHRFNWIDARKFSILVRVFINSLWLGFISATAIAALLGVYHFVVGNASSFVFFWQYVYSLWLIMAIMILLWAVIYMSTCYLRQLKTLELKEAEVALQLKQAQLNSLAGQLNPHFLFNGLNNIRSLILEDPTRARQMMTALADILRYSLQSNERTCQTLQEEVDIVRSYLELAAIQYEERLVYIENIDAQLLHHKVPPMIIQLMAENAIRHGIDRSETGGELVFSLALDHQNDQQNKQQIKIEVTNPGSLNPADPANKSIGLGIKNIKQRLKLLYADKASFSLSQRGGIVCATAVIPLSSTKEKAKEKTDESNHC